MLNQIKIFLISLMMSTSDATAIPQVDLNELTCMTHGIYYESASEPLEGKYGVANVVNNRVSHPDFKSNTVCGILKEKGQFSYWKNTKRLDMNDAKVVAQIEESAKAALDVMTGAVGDNTNGALYFANTAVSTDRAWIKRMNKKFTRTTKIKNHTYYRKRR